MQLYLVPTCHTLSRMPSPLLAPMPWGRSPPPTGRRRSSCGNPPMEAPSPGDVAVSADVVDDDVVGESGAADERWSSATGEPTVITSMRDSGDGGDSKAGMLLLKG